MSRSSASNASRPIAKVPFARRMRSSRSQAAYWSNASPARFPAPASAAFAAEPSGASDGRMARTNVAPAVALSPATTT